MVKYKNKNLKITLSLVVSTMSIIMANCMDGQGSGSSSSNAPAASGSRSLNTSTVMWHLLKFLSHQNEIKASQSALENTQSALQNTQSALVGRVNGLELTIIRNQRHLTNQIDAEHVITSLEIAGVRRELADVIADVRRKFSDSHRGLLDVNRKVLDNHREGIDGQMATVQQEWHQKLSKLSDTIIILKSDKKRTEEQLEALQRKVDLMDNDTEHLQEKPLLTQIRELKSRDEGREQDIRTLQDQNNKLQKDIDTLLQMYGKRGCPDCNIL